jgi:LCP family protein required for cell wall assembly
LVIAVLAVAFTLVTGLLSYLVFVTVRDMTASWVGTGLNPFQGGGGGQPSAGTPVPGSTPLATYPPVEPQPWSGYERVTILLMGLDYRDWVAGQGAPRTDSMMLVTFDPLTHTAGMLSIPRDLYVEIPGFGFNRINTAYMFGEAYRMPGLGPALAVQVVENVTGVPIQFYAVVDFQTFERLIDEIGGIDVLVTERIKISPIGRESIWLDPKAYHLDGAEALAYARVRKGAGDDFGRARRQQQVALAVIDRVLDPAILARLVGRAPVLFQELAAGIRTNMGLDQMISLGWLAIQTPRDSIRSGVIGPPDMVGFHTLPDGAAILRQVPDQIRILRDRIFSDTSAFGPWAGGQPTLVPTP